MSSRNYRIMKFFEPMDDNSTAKGYVKMDMRGSKGKITVNTENIASDQPTSDVYLLKNRNDKFKVGSINNKKGKIQKNITVAPADEPFEDYNVCAIVNNNRIVLYAPLYGLMAKAQIPYLTQSITDEKVFEDVPEEVKPAVEEPVKQSVEEKTKEVVEKQSESVENIKADIQKNKQIIENIKSVIDASSTIDSLTKREEDIVDNALNNNEQEEINQNTQNSFIQIDEDGIEINGFDDDDEYSFNDSDDDYDVEIASKGKRRRKFRNEFEKNLYSLLDEFEVIEPLAYNIKNMSWWKIPFDENSIYKGFLPYFNQIVSTYYPYPLSNRVTTCQGLMKNYGYYLFGIYEENDKMNKFVYGIPGRFIRDDQPYRGVTGFKNWSYKSSSIPGDYGFWLAFIDSNSGNIVDPPAIDE